MIFRTFVFISLLIFAIFHKGRKKLYPKSPILCFKSNNILFIIHYFFEYFFSIEKFLLFHLNLHQQSPSWSSHAAEYFEQNNFFISETSNKHFNIHRYSSPIFQYTLWLSLVSIKLNQNFHYLN